MITYPNVKINLGLSVIRKRDDGFHELETLFVPFFGLHDELEITLGGSAGKDWADISIEREGGVDWDPQKDLCAMAWKMLSADFDIPSMKIRLTKHNPVGAGLGGGSSDAAFTLKMINELAGLGLSEDALAAYAARLGSDCAFFIYNRPMIGRGRGEILSECNLDLSEYEFDIIIPEGISVSTKQAYAGITPREKMEAQPMPLMQALELPAEQWKEHLVNDFENTVFAAYPRLAEIKKELYRSGALYASMSGSGSALFCLRRKA